MKDLVELSQIVEFRSGLWDNFQKIILKIFQKTDGFSVISDGFGLKLFRPNHIKFLIKNIILAQESKVFLKGCPVFS